ncbi:hypothetical protein Pst134EA_027079 [Puccinia striiformis f. sp. tritici]|uniref:hypothetical protein n=1 Tax=Puccinia striiformis f. sp. tritici TaxID=168172 RepID=UPI0020076E15|nr:hypothetical protein Pst134EA_027079 [Puccinia striiformis f. sp. tritici]KAH9450374.1 hypothetical protein Pst134EA_027079 [Puccinia striiformis f. sp. tritici]
MFSYKISDLLHTATILLSLQTITNGQNHPSDLPKTVGHESTPIKEPEVYIAKVDIQCGNNYNTFPIGKGMVCKPGIILIVIADCLTDLVHLTRSLSFPTACTNYGDWQYKCKEESCYVGTDRKKLASEELNFYDCARLGIAELLPEILAVRYKAANLGGAIEIMDENGQEYGCRWTKPSDPSNVRVSCSYCEEQRFLEPTAPIRSDL